ncbi:hypothetical protein KAJ87_04320, partial [Candidatus Pacearchaeota archaeon]|nr:hypothetical protein [Candidatus Pacearchaeota archaeon]
ISYAVGSEVEVVRGSGGECNPSESEPEPCTKNGESGTRTCMKGGWWSDCIASGSNEGGTTNNNEGGTNTHDLKLISNMKLPSGFFSIPWGGSSDDDDDDEPNKDPKEKDKKDDDKKFMLGGMIEVKKGGFSEAIIGGFMWAGMAYGIVKMAGPMLGMDDDLVDAASKAVFAGILAGKMATTLFGKGGAWGDKFREKYPNKWKGKPAEGAGGTGLGVGIGVTVGIIVFLMSYRKEEIEVITFSCNPWDAQVGGDDCEECNKQGLPCSEYQCRSLGQACELLNPGTDEEKCDWVGRNDVEFPIIKPWKDALLENYEYKIQDTGISPPDTGVIIWNNESTKGCARAFTPLSFGITLDEPGKCKIDALRKKDFEDMDFYFSSSLSLYEHSYALSLPGANALKTENITIENDGDYELYVRCQDANGNSNIANFVFKFCVETGPDTTPPLIVTTDPLNGKPIAYNQTSFGTIVYVNEPADCRWSHTDQDYENMEEEMVCSSSVFNMNAQMLYECSTTLTGLKDREENKFYFRCKDKAENVNRESYEFSLIGTQPLVIDWIKPESGSVIKDSSDAIQVTLEAKTSAGYDEGLSACEYSNTGETEDYVLFLGDEKIDQYQHSQDLWLAEGDYEYFIKCTDLGGNYDIKTTNFSVEGDSSAPLIIRAYHEDTYLKLITNEPARCVYDTKYEDYPCDYLFDDGTPMTAIDDVNHYTEWDTNVNFYIKCQDEYGIQPAPDECSRIIRPFEIY